MEERNSWRVSFTYIRVKNKKCHIVTAFDLQLGATVFPSSTPRSSPDNRFVAQYFFYKQSTVTVYLLLDGSWFSQYWNNNVCTLYSENRKKIPYNIYWQWLLQFAILPKRPAIRIVQVRTIVVDYRWNYVSFEKCLHSIPFNSKTTVL